MRIHTIVVACVMAVGGCAPNATTRALEPTAPHAHAVPNVLVTTSQECPPSCAPGNTCHILEVVDLHTQATSEDKGFDELRVRAASLGADAVIGAEFEHGDGDEPSHLSGMIVRDCVPIPAYVELGTIDVPSEPLGTDKGLAKLMPRARAMGGD